jgi:hypothetical protein
MSTQPKYDGHNPTMFDEGLKVRRAVVGDAYVDKALQGGASEFSWPGQQLVSATSSGCGQLQTLMSVGNGVLLGRDMDKART